MYIIIIIKFIYILIFLQKNKNKQYKKQNNMSSNRVITWEEAVEHIQPDSCWLIMDGGVYDVTDYLFQHPGSEKPLLKYAGQNCSAAFKRVKHSNDAFKIRESKKIGVIEENKPSPKYWLKLRNNNWQNNKYSTKEIKKNKYWVVFEDTVIDLTTVNGNTVPYSQIDQYKIGLVDTQQDIKDRQNIIITAALGIVSLVTAGLLYRKYKK